MRKRSRRLHSASPASLTLVVLLVFLVLWYWSTGSRQLPQNYMDSASVTPSPRASIVARIQERIQSPPRFMRMPLGGLLLDLSGMDGDVRAVLQGTATVVVGLSLQTAIDAAFSAALREPSFRAVAADRGVLTEDPQEGLCASLGGLDLGSNLLTSVCDSIRFCRRLQLLFLTNNQLTAVPPALRHLPLTRLSLKENRLTSLNPAAELTPTLVHLIATENRISTLTSSFSDGGGFPALRKLMLGGNSLTDWTQVLLPRSATVTLPALEAIPGVTVEPSGGRTTTFLQSLQLLRLSRNAMSDSGTALGRSTEFFHAIAAMPRLSWFSIAGNPCMLPQHTQRTGKWRSDEIRDLFSSLTDLTGRVRCRRSLDSEPEILGRGASGVVLRCVLDGSHDVAVKFFKRVSSDGSGADEILALTKVPHHRNLLAPVGYLAFRSAEALAQLTGLPWDTVSRELFAFSVEGDANIENQPHVDELRTAVVFPLVRAQNLGKPPTIWTVADDIFSGDDKHSSNVDGNDFSPPLPLRPSALLQEWGALRTVPSGEPLDSLLASDAADVDYYYEVVSASLLGALMLVEGVAAAVASLHLRSTGKLLHGDVYAHNMFFGLVAAVGDNQERAEDVATQPHETKIRAAMHTLEAHVQANRRDPSTQEAPSHPAHVSTTSWWLSRRILLSDFGAAFPYDHLPLAVHRALQRVEVRSVLVSVADVLEHVVPLRYLASQPAERRDARQLSSAVASRLSSLETSLDVLAARCRDGRGSTVLREHCLRSVSAVALVVARCAEIARGDAEESFEALLFVMSDAIRLL